MDTNAPTPLRIPAGVRTLVSTNDAHTLANHLVSPERQWPTVVVTTAHGHDAPHIDANAIADELRGLAEVVSIASQDASWKLTEHLPPGTQVYGGATRVYPTGHAWHQNPRRAPITLTHSRETSPRSVEKVVSDAMSAALAAGLLERPTTTPSQPVTGTVSGVLNERALIELPNGTLATLREELTGYGIPLDRLVQKGQQLTGRHDKTSGRFDLEPRRVTATTLPDTYRPGATVLVRVTSVRRDGLTAQLIPGIEIDVPREAVTGNERDAVNELFDAGEVVAVHLTALDPLAASFLDVDDDEQPLQAPAILDGGPPWLLLPPTRYGPNNDNAATNTEPPRNATTDLPHPHDPEPAPPAEDPRPATARPTPTAPAAPKPTPPAAGTALRDTQLSLAAANAEVTRLTSAANELRLVKTENQALEVEVHRLTRELHALRERYRTTDRKRQALEKKAKSADAAPPSDTDSRPHFTTPDRALHHDVTATWVRTVPAAEKTSRTLPEWSVGPDFNASLTNLGNVTWEKLCAVVLDVLLQEPDRLAAREDHSLRTSLTGPAFVRADGATARRVYLQQNSASARRLHYWKNGADIEISRVVLHDDFEP